MSQRTYRAPFKSDIRIDYALILIGVGAAWFAVSDVVRVGSTLKTRIAIVASAFGCVRRSRGKVQTLLRFCLAFSRKRSRVARFWPKARQGKTSIGQDSFTPRMCESCIRQLHTFAGPASGALSPPTLGNRDLPAESQQRQESEA